MFHLFKKKHAPEAETETPEVRQPEARHPEAAALAAQFGPEEFDIVAVTGPNGFGGEKEEGAEYWTATLPLIAWREDDGPIRQENTCLVALADDILLDYLRRSAPRDSVIQARVRKGLADDRFLLVGLPSPVADREMKAVLDRATQEVSVWVPEVGTFVLNRRLNWFEADVEWIDKSVIMVYENDSEAEQRAAQATALALMKDVSVWDATIRTFALEKMWGQEADPPEWEGLTQNEALERLDPESIQVWGDGRFEVWSRDREHDWGRSAHICGNLKDGITQAEWES